MHSQKIIDQAAKAFTERNKDWRGDLFINLWVEKRKRLAPGDPVEVKFDTAVAYTDLNGAAADSLDPYGFENFSYFGTAHVFKIGDTYSGGRLLDLTDWGQELADERAAEEAADERHNRSLLLHGQRGV